jgi:hypothetical protein
MGSSTYSAEAIASLGIGKNGRPQGRNPNDRRLLCLVKKGERWSPTMVADFQVVVDSP